MESFDLQERTRIGAMNRAPVTGEADPLQPALHPPPYVGGYGPVTHFPPAWVSASSTRPGVRNSGNTMGGAAAFFGYTKTSGTPARS